MTIAANASDSTRHKMHWTTKIGVAAVILFMLVVAGLNAVGWIHTLPGAAGIAASVVAISLELMAFVSWEHLVAYRKAKDYGRFSLALIGLVLAVLMNIEGGHRGLDHMAAPFHEQVEVERREAQAQLDAERGAIADQIAVIQARIDAQASTNPGLTFPGRMEQWRQNFELVTAEDRRQIAALRARLDQMPVTVAAREPYPTWVPYAVAAAFAFFSVFGLTMFGVKVPGPELTVASGRAGALALALSRQRPMEARERDASGQFVRAARVPPLTEQEVRDAIEELTKRGAVVTLTAVAKHYGVPISRASKSPAADLIRRQRSREGAPTMMAEQARAA